MASFFFKVIYRFPRQSLKNKTKEQCQQDGGIGGPRPHPPKEAPIYFYPWLKIPL